MTREEIHDLMENELRCVQRGNYCNRDCAKCPLVKEDKELIEAYGYVIKALEQEPKAGHWIKEESIYGWDGHSYQCSVCGRSIHLDTVAEALDDYPYCHCGAKMIESEG